MRYRFYTADVFTDRPFGGNQLAVFPDAQGLDPARMQQVAREFNLSETVFVLPPDDPAHTRRLRIFAPAVEMPFAGHPTVGTAYLLAAIGAIALAGEETRIVFEEGVGPVPVAIQAAAGRPVFARLWAAQMPQWGPPPPPPSALAAIVALAESDLLVGEEDAPEAISCGLPFLFVPVRDRAAMDRIRFQPQQWEATLAGYWAPQLFLFTYEVALPGSQLHARMFAPALGIVEDPATGAAATALGGYLGKRAAFADGTGHWRVEQGFAMGRPSLLDVTVEKQAGAITAITVGGAAVLVSEGWMEIPD